MARFQVDIGVRDELAVSVIRVKHDGSLEVCVCDARRILGVHQSAVRATAQEAADAASELAMPEVERRQAKWDAQQAAAAQRLAGGGAGAGASNPRAPRAAPTGDALRGGAPVVINWDGPVPRNAAHWEVTRAETGELVSIFVILREGLYFSDGSTDRTFTTLRSAKDDVRAATPNAQASLF